MRGASFFTYGREPGRIGRGPALAAFVAVLLLAAGLRLYTVFSESLSGDEIFQRNIAAQPYFQQPSLIRGDIHPPLYYWLTKASASVFGYGVFGLRLPALVFGWLTVLLTMVLALRLFCDVRLALAAGLLVSLSDIQIVFSHFARSYAFLSALVLAYILVLDLALRKSERRSSWLTLTGLSILMAYTHYFAWLFIAAIAPAVLFHKNRRARWRWVLTAAVA
ncbi:MAG: glycosyltransferase family 39 protein, partial [Candidatus Aminicenantes bacterium]|nr:glycosyltransferase family 39 protein [Candidatus Aminicenantes bacterium]